MKLIYISLLIFTFNLTLYADSKLIALYYPQKTISLPTENAQWLSDNFYRWEMFLVQNKFKYEVVFDADLENGLSNDYSILILPAARCLNDGQMLSIKEFLNEGNSVLATWGLGIYGENGKWNGWEFMEQIFGVRFISEIPQKDASRVHSLFGGTPLSSNIPAGFRLQFTTYDKPIEVKINSNNTYPLGYLLNSEILFEGKPHFDNSTAAVYGTFGKGTFVWFGFEFSSIVATKSHQMAANNLLKNAINWLGNELVVQLATWPNGKQSAAVLSGDVEFKFDYINNALDIFEQENIPAQFYILLEAIDPPSFIRLKKIGDIGLHGDTHLLFKWQDYLTQKSRISNALKVLENDYQEMPIAFRPPETFYDDATIRAMSSENLKVLSSDFIEDRSVPQFHPDYPELFVIPKTGFDDYDVFERLKLQTVNEQAERYILDLQRTHEEGGLYTLNYHTQMQCRKEFVDALIKPIEHIKSRDIWFTTHNQVYNWWKKKSSIVFKTKVISDKSSLLEVENTGDSIIEEIAFGLYKNKLMDLSAVRITLDGKNLDFTTDYSSRSVKVILPKIYPKETKRLTIGY